MALEELSAEQVDQIYQENPEIEDPNYPHKKWIGAGTTPEAQVFRIKIKDKEYLIHSSPHYGDTWYKEIILTDNFYDCPICGNPAQSGSGVCDHCESEGYWIDPAGGIHTDDEEDPAAMYE